MLQLCIKDAALYYVVSDGGPGFAVFNFNHSRMSEGNRSERKNMNRTALAAFHPVHGSLESNSQLKVDHPFDTLFSTAALLIPMKRIAGSHRM